MISKGSKMKYIKRTCVLLLGAVLVFTQNGINAQAEQSKDYNIQMEQSCNGVNVFLSAPEGVFPAGSYFEVREINNTEENDIDKAISEIRDKNEQVAVSYTYDITVYDADGNEIEPNTEYGQVSVTFSMNEAQDSNLQAKVYHVEDSGDELSAEELETNVSGDEVTVLTDGFSYYVVEFEYTYTDGVHFEYFIKSCEEVKLVDILNKLGFSKATNDAISEAYSNNNGLTVEKRDDIWYVSSTTSFSSNAVLTVSFIENSELRSYNIDAKYEQSDTGVTYLKGIISNEYVLKVCSTCSVLANETQKLEGGKYYYVSGNVNCSERLQVEADENNPAHLILGESATLKLDKGISVNQGKSLYIYAETEENMGSLEAYGEDGNAGIGGDKNNVAGTISIYSGIIEATGGENAAGIGGGNGGSGGAIQINGGFVTARGGDNAAGIGGGKNGNADSIVINNGEVTSQGGSYAAGIGGGLNGAATSIQINGGTVKAYGYQGGISGAGIGSGAGGHTNGQIVICDGDIEAVGGGSGAGIGGGRGSCNPLINIVGGKVDAKGGEGAAGIGSGSEGGTYTGNAEGLCAQDIVIGGTAEVKAIGGGNGFNSGGAGIGGGWNSLGGKIIIQGDAIIETEGKAGGAGIGGGFKGKVGQITIDGGKITATGNNGGAGIGSGLSGINSAEININNGEINAKTSGGGAGIGAGKGSAKANVNVDETKFGKITPEDLAKGKLPKTPVKNEEPSTSDDVTKTATEDSGASVSTVPDEPLLKGFQGMGNLRGVCTYATQGPLCRAAFKAATPTGFAEAFSFNLYMNATGKNTPDYNRKEGRLTLNVPKRFVKNGRIFSLIGVDKNGKTKVFYDIDKADETFTANLDMEGYAFLLIYSDSAAKSDRAFSSLQTGSIYTVKSGDTLSAIAGQLGVTLRRLIDMNDLDDPDKLSIGQRIKY